MDQAVRGAAFSSSSNERESGERESGCLYGLTPRQSDVLRRLLRGLGDAAIAAQLKIKPSTVRQHRKDVCAHFGVRTRMELFALFADVNAYRGDPASRRPSPAMRATLHSAVEFV